MMTQNEFKEKIELYLESLIEIKKQCDEKRLNCPKTIIECIGWIKEILVELRYGNIPEPFYERILTHGFDFLVSMLQMAKDVLAGSTVEKGLEGIEKYFSQPFQMNIDSYNFYKSLSYAQQNTVLVGANGCGKTTLANTLRQTLNVRDGIVIPAQKLLIIPTFSSTPNYAATIKNYDSYQHQIIDDKQTFNVSKDDDIPYGLTHQYGAEFRFVLSALYSERLSRRNKYCDAIQRNESPSNTDLESLLDKVINIWNYLIEHRTLKCDDSNNLVISTINEAYPAYQMSDGERIILYLIGRVLLAPEQSLIVVDEPEMYLHKTIVEKLWNKLETERCDCVFIYLTHDLQFAASRNAKKCWIRSFEYPSRWNIEVIQDNVIPEELLLKLLGSRKKILFCEGKRNSLDSKVFELLFEDYTITPIETCKDVINFTRSFNKIPNTVAKAYGIIDHDFRSKEQLAKLEEQNVFSYDVAEVENLFLLPDVITGFAKYKNEECNIDEIKTSILNKFEQDKQAQASQFVSSAINAYFKSSHVSTGNKKEEIESNFQKFISEIDINKLFHERESYINDIIANKEYEKAIMLYNNKGLHSVIEKYFNMGDYRHKVLDYLRKTKEIDPIKRIFPNKLWNTD